MSTADRTCTSCGVALLTLVHYQHAEGFICDRCHIKERFVAENPTHPLAALSLNGPQAVKFDTEKVRVELLNAEAIEGLAKVLTWGAKKYADDNWAKGLGWRRMLGALIRHAFAVLRGEDIDPESGLPHIDHCGCNWMFLSASMKLGLGKDDRWKKPNA